MEEKIYRLRIVLRGGAAVEADVINPEIVPNKDRTGIERLEWENPRKGRSASQLVFVDLAEIVAVTLEERPGGEIAF